MLFHRLIISLLRYLQTGMRSGRRGEHQVFDAPENVVAFAWHAIVKGRHALLLTQTGDGGVELVQDRQTHVVADGVPIRALETSEQRVAELGVN
jgi:hypothetical protein